MKKIIITFAILFLSFSAFARFTVGPKLALNFSELTVRYDNLKSSMEPGFDLGLFARIGRQFYVQPEVTYSFKNNRLRDLPDTDFGSMRVSSIDIPVLLGYQFGGNLANLRAFAGPKFSFITNNNFSKAHEDLSNFNFGGQLGLGFDLLVFTVDFRYERTFSNMSNISQHTLHNSGFLISLGVKLM